MSRPLARPLDRPLSSDDRGATALEFAIVFPVFILFFYGMLACYSLIVSWRAMDLGLQRAMRSTAVSRSVSTADVKAAFKAGADIVSPDVGTNATVSLTGTVATGNTVKISATYAWTPMASFNYNFGGGAPTTIFKPLTLANEATVKVIYPN